MRSGRAIALDWSGAAAAAPQREHVWTAEVDAATGRLRRLEHGRTRDEAVADLDASTRGVDGDVLVGIDFSFSYPAWFVDRCGAEDAVAFRAVVAREAERWLAECRPPFWGRPGKRRPSEAPDRPALRRCEAAAAVEGIRPKSPFQIGGAGAVGTASLRGIPYLDMLAAAGSAIWPFDAPARRTVVEVWPRLWTGPVNKSDADARAALLARRGLAARMPAAAAADAAASADAFDTAVTAFGLAAGPLPRPVLLDAAERREGRFWHPA